MPGTGTPQAGAGHGEAVLDAKPGKNQLCLTLVVTDVGRVASVHVHAGSVGVTGPIVASFDELATGKPVECVTVGDDVIKRIRKDPGQFYVDVHTAEPPNGGPRGQLAR